MDRLVDLACSVVSVPQVVERWIVKRVEANRFDVVLNCFVVVILVAVAVTDVVVALNFLGV